MYNMQTFIRWDFFQKGERSTSGSMWHAGTRIAKDIRDTFSPWISSPWHEIVPLLLSPREKKAERSRPERTRSEFFISINTGASTA